MHRFDVQEKRNVRFSSRGPCKEKQKKINELGVCVCRLGTILHASENDNPLQECGCGTFAGHAAERRATCWMGFSSPFCEKASRHHSASFPQATNTAEHGDTNCGDSAHPEAENGVQHTPSPSPLDPGRANRSIERPEDRDLAPNSTAAHPTKYCVSIGISEEAGISEKQPTKESNAHHTIRPRNMTVPPADWSPSPTALSKTNGGKTTTHTKTSQTVAQNRAKRKR